MVLFLKTIFGASKKRFKPAGYCSVDVRYGLIHPPATYGFYNHWNICSYPISKILAPIY